MKTRLLPVTLLVAGLSYGGAATAQNAIDIISPIAGNIATGTLTMDWTSNGQGLALNQGPFGSLPTFFVPYDFLYQSSFTGVTGGSGITPTLIPFLLDDPTTNPGVFGAGQWEITIVSRLEQIPIPAGALSVFNNPTLAGTYDTVSIYMDGPGVVPPGNVGKPAQLASGDGFDDGIEIYTGRISSGLSVFSVSPIDPNIGAGSSQITFNNAPFVVDPLYLAPSAAGQVINQFVFQAQQNYPPGNGETDNFHIGGAAKYPNHVGHPVNDLNLRVDGDSHFDTQDIPPSVADVYLQKTHTSCSLDPGSVPTIPIGGNAPYVLTLGNEANCGAQACLTATNIEVQDRIPLGVTPVLPLTPPAGSSASYDPALRLLTWTVNSLNPGATTQYTVNTTLDSYGTRTNQAQVTNLDQTDLDSTPNNQPWNPIRLPLEDDEVQVTETDLCEADVSLTKTHAECSIIGGASMPSIPIGGNAPFVLTLSNAANCGAQACVIATDIEVQDQIPPGVTPALPLTPPAGSSASYDPVTRLLTWSVNSLNPGASTQLAVDTSLDAYGSRTNQAQVTAMVQPDIDSTPNNQAWSPVRLPLEDDEAQVSATDICEADVWLTKTHTQCYLDQYLNPSLQIGGNAPYSFTLGNAANCGAQACVIATNVQVQDRIPLGVTPVLPLTPPAGSSASYDPNTRLLTWNVNSLTPGATTQLTLDTTLDTYGERTNQAQVTAMDQTDIDSTPNNQAWSPVRLPLEDDEAQVIASDNCDSTPRIPVLPPMAYLLLCGMLVLVGVRSLRRGN